jgi:hypothetical protein
MAREHYSTLTYLLVGKCFVLNRRMVFLFPGL